MSDIKPATYGGYGRQKGLYGELEGLEFAARCPPDVKPNSRVVAVCGPPDWNNNPSPDKDGWFFSDFFLFWQMLKDQDISNQRWLSCCSPADLVRRYGRYVHGHEDILIKSRDGKEADLTIPADRKVVMSTELLPQDEFRAGFRKFSPEELCDSFLAALREEINEGARLRQPVLILMFGHGSPSSYGVYLGSESENPRLFSPQMLASVLRKDVQTTLVTTSCFSAGWLMRPNLTPDFQSRPMMNISIMTAAGRTNESVSWKESETMGRASGGSVFATCLLNSLTIATNGAGRFYKVEEDDRGEDISNTMADITQTIVSKVKEYQPGIWHTHNFSFAAQDDLWSSACEARTGFPILDYRKRWEGLPNAPASGPPVHSQTVIHRGSSSRRGSNYLQNIVKAKAIMYMASNPGKNNSGGNTPYHSTFRRLIEGQSFEFDALRRLNDVLDHRKYQMEQAELYCHYMEIDMTYRPKADEFDEESWEVRWLKEMNNKYPVRAQLAETDWKRYELFKAQLFDLEIFDAPIGDQGFPYFKPRAYLAAMLADSRIPVEEICRRLEKLQQDLLKEALTVARSPLGEAVLNKVPQVGTLRTRLTSTMGKMVRSLSPGKR